MIDIDIADLQRVLSWLGSRGQDQGRLVGGDDQPGRPGAPLDSP